MNATNQSLGSLKDLCFRLHSIIPDDYVILDYFSIVLAIIINLLTCPIVILLNALVITAIRTKARLQTDHSILLACLAVTDLLVGIGAEPAFIIQQIMVLVGGLSSLSCSLFNIIQLTILCLLHVSYLHLAVISLERFVAMKYSLRYEEIVTKFRLIVAIAFCWVVPTFNLVFTIFHVRLRLVLLSITSLSFPVIIFCHSYVYFICRRHEIQINSEQVSQEATEKLLKEKKAWKTTSIIIGCVFICYFPGFVIRILPEMFSSYLIRRICVSLRPLFWTFLIFNSLCNPIIYCWRSKEIRKASIQLVKKPASGVQDVM